MSAELIFEEPPVQKTGPGADRDFRAWLSALRQHPGQWVKYPEPVYTAKGTNIRRGLYGVKPGEYEVRTARANSGRKSWLYACYVGGKS